MPQKILGLNYKYVSLCAMKQVGATKGTIKTQNQKEKTITWNKETQMTGQHEPLWNSFIISCVSECVFVYQCCAHIWMNQWLYCWNSYKSQPWNILRLFLSRLRLVAEAGHMRHFSGGVSNVKFLRLALLLAVFLNVIPQL